MGLLKELYNWIEKGKVSQTSGDYAKGWNDSIDSILRHVEKLLVVGVPNRDTKYL